jgi:hypothetical protein
VQNNSAFQLETNSTAAHAPDFVTINSGATFYTGPAGYVATYDCDWDMELAGGKYHRRGSNGIAHSGQLTITGQGTIYNENQHGHIDLDGKITGSGLLVLSNNGGNKEIRLNNANNDYSGGTHVKSTASGDSVRATAAGSLGTGDVTVFDGGVLRLDVTGAMNPAAQLYLLGSASGFLDMNADTWLAGLHYGGTWNPTEELVEGGDWAPSGVYDGPGPLSDPVDLTAYVDFSGGAHDGYHWLTIEGGAGGAAIPEPAGLGLLGLLALSSTLRRRPEVSVPKRALIGLRRRRA